MRNPAIKAILLHKTTTLSFRQTWFDLRLRDRYGSIVFYQSEVFYI